jgi:hypothetical protein
MADEQTAEQDEKQTDGGGEEQSKEAKLAQQKEEDREQAKETMKEIEEGEPPENLEDWPDDAAKYETYGGPDGQSYEDGPETKLGPSSLRHHPDGTVTIAGEEVENPDDYKGEPIPGGPTDESSPDDLTAKKIKDDQKDGDGDGSGEDSDGDEKD